ncbi:hypothetical protein HOE22_05915 [Candidatus Woesearchaeota archaeon]|nr:hypothetical protein [Candidatus Woesearchaeota archaeon]
MAVNVKFKILKDYPTVNGMLHKNDVVMIDEKSKTFIGNKNIQVKDLTGKIWFVETKYLKQL